ncbi:hypothetical protein CcarbDRAFT_4759 [Clostridium carboxidivorans P7]|uniref:Uncharacterized protein n=1 Tax=Clostridium carboxidivorans P7 TaxID=536227 RepID=C6Q142_9CLOT|nr:hypothetical protein CcarbDRAFT_4759 [Clostridium carboxidivorans P7]
MFLIKCILKILNINADIILISLLGRQEKQNLHRVYAERTKGKISRMVR